MMSRMYGETYNEALQFKEQRDELLEAAEDYINTMKGGNIMNYEEIERLAFKFNKAIKKIKGDDK